MRRSLMMIALCLLCLPCPTFAPAARPAISGLSFVDVEVSSLESASHFYGQELGLFNLKAGCLGRSPTCFALLGANQIGISQAPPEKTDRIQIIGFHTHDAAKLRKYLIARGVVPSELMSDSRTSHYFGVLDPEKHKLIFGSRERILGYGVPSTAKPVSKKIIHAGFVVHDRVAMDRFYKDILGFHVYWQGGRKEGETNWVDMQVPDGTDWLEYMLNVSPNASHKTLGVMNHIALGVADIHAAEKQLRANGWTGTEEPKIGLDGKWQLNLYDPDETRVELMEFTPAKEPCCSPYTGPHPGPKPGSKQ